MSPGEAEELVEEWLGRLDRFCVALEQQGFGVQRDGLSVRIEAPQRPECSGCGGPACEGCSRCLRLSKDNSCSRSQCLCD